MQSSKIKLTNDWQKVLDTQVGTLLKANLGEILICVGFYKDNTLINKINLTMR